MAGTALVFRGAPLPQFLAQGTKLCRFTSPQPGRTFQSVIPCKDGRDQAPQSLALGIGSRSRRVCRSLLAASYRGRMSNRVRRPIFWEGRNGRASASRGGDGQRDAAHDKWAISTSLPPVPPYLYDTQLGSPRATKGRGHWAIAGTDQSQSIKGPVGAPRPSKNPYLPCGFKQSPSVATACQKPRRRVARSLPPTRPRPLSQAADGSVRSTIGRKLAATNPEGGTPPKSIDLASVPSWLAPNWGCAAARSAPRTRAAAVGFFAWASRLTSSDFESAAACEGTLWRLQTHIRPQFIEIGSNWPCFSSLLTPAISFSTPARHQAVPAASIARALRSRSSRVESTALDEIQPGRGDQMTRITGAIRARVRPPRSACRHLLIKAQPPPHPTHPSTGDAHAAPRRRLRRL